MNINDLYPSTFLKSSDIKGAKPKVTIERWSQEELGDGTKKPVLHFVGKDKGLVLNKTNAITISMGYGEDINLWVGKDIFLMVQPVQGPNGIVDGLRVEVPRPEPEIPGFDDSTAF